MLDPSKHLRIEHEDDPERCNAIAGSHQCYYKQVPGSNFCDMHGGNTARQQLDQASLKMYRLALWQAEVGQFSGHANLKSLREEIGILRMLMQTKLNQCKDAQDLMLRSSSLSELAMKITKVVEACDRIDARVGKLIDRDQILQLGEEIIKLVSTVITEPDKLQIFAKQLVNLISNDPLVKRNDASAVSGTN
jgi:hypothetical protein